MNYESELLDLISQRTGFPGPLRENLEFEQDLNLSPEELVEFVEEVENKFKTTFTDEEINGIKTILDLKEALLDHLEGGHL